MDVTADPDRLNAALAKIHAEQKAANDAAEAAARDPAFLSALKVAYTLAKGLAPVAVGIANPGAGVIVAAGVRLLDAADGDL